jgi:membrane-associated phospholipid phosphatase
MTPVDPQIANYWHWLTRLGEIQILMPGALLALLALARRSDTHALAIRWLSGLLLGALITTGSKLAFIGWGLGVAELDFTGFSGHAMFAAAIYPMLLGTLNSRLPPGSQKLAIGLGFALAGMVGVSRIMVGAHSGSEVLAGLALGTAVSFFALARSPLPRATVGPLIPALVALWFLLSPVHAPTLQTHSLVTRLSLLMSGHQHPYTRSDMWRDFRARQRPRGDSLLRPWLPNSRA